MLQKTGLFGEALTAFTKVLEIVGHDRVVYESRGKVYQDMRSHQLAVADFDQAIALEPTHPDSYIYKGMSLIRLQQWAEAINYFNKAIDLFTEKEQVPNPMTYNGLGLAYQLQGDFILAIENLSKSIEIDPKSIDFLVDRAMIYHSSKDFKSSAKDLNKAIELSPQDPQLHYKCGLAYYAMHQYDVAMSYFQSSLNMSPFPTYEPDVYYHLGLCYANLDQNELAIGPFSKCIDLCPTEPVYYHERAKAYQMTEKHEEALHDFNTVIEMQPTNAHAYFRRAFSLKVLKQYAEAATDFNRAKELQPENAKLVINPKKLRGMKCIIICRPGEEPSFK